MYIADHSNSIVIASANPLDSDRCVFLPQFRSNRVVVLLSQQCATGRAVLAMYTKYEIECHLRREQVALLQST
jgi:hypothetical protein